MSSLRLGHLMKVEHPLQNPRLSPTSMMRGPCTIILIVKCIGLVQMAVDPVSSKDFSLVQNSRPQDRRFAGDYRGAVASGEIFSSVHQNLHIGPLVSQ